MKRRGFKPTLSTYSSLLTIFTKIESWQTRGKLLQTVDKVYSQYLEYVATVKATNPQSPEISSIPATLYMTCLSRAGEYARTFDVLNSLDEEGPLSANHITYTTMFRTMYRQGTAEEEDEVQAQKNRERAASDARFLWRQLTKRIEGGTNIKVDARLISSVIQVLALGRPADHIVAFDILRDYAGLAKPGETAQPARVEVSPPLVQDVLWLCNRAQKYRICVHFVQQLMERQPDVLDRGHIDHVLQAYGQLSALGSLTEAARALQTLEWLLERSLTAKDNRLRPGLATYTLVLTVCWRAKDWESALRTFELMTGLRGEAFVDGATGKPEAPAGTRSIKPGAAAMSCLARTALECGDRAAMRQCARIIAHLGVTQILAPTEDGERAAEVAAQQRPGGNAGASFAQERTFYTHKAARAVQELVDVLVPRKTEGARRLTAEEREWVGVRSEAKTFLIEQREHRPRGTPQLEETPLGSAAGLAAMDSVVEWDRIHREQKGAR